MSRVKKSQRQKQPKTPKNKTVTQAIKSAKSLRKAQLQKLKKSTDWTDLMFHVEHMHGMGMDVNVETVGALLHTLDECQATRDRVVGIFGQFPTIDDARGPIDPDNLERRHTALAEKTKKQAPRRAHAWMVHNILRQTR